MLTRRWTRARAWLTVLAAFAATAPVARAQTASRPLLLVPTGDSVRVLLPESPEWGAVVFRRPAAPAARASAWTQLTAEPVRRITDPARAQELLGADRGAVMRALGATDGVQTVRRLIYDRFTGSVQALLYPGAAFVRGQLFVDTTVKKDSSYAYRVAYLTANGKDTARAVTGTVRVVDVTPAPPSAVRAVGAGQDVRVTWNYPRYTGAAGDYVIAFDVYRVTTVDSVPRYMADLLRVDGVPREWRDRDVRPGVAYTYTMRAVDAAQREGPPSAAATVALVDQRPIAAPADVVADGSDGTVHLVWRMSPEARVAGYRVERATTMYGHYMRVNAGAIPVQSPQFVDSTAVGDGRYFYKVVAVDSAGVASEPSAAAPVIAEDHTPPAPPGAIALKLEGRRDAMITWHASSSADVKGYYVYRGDDTTALVRLTTKPVAATQFLDSGFANKGLQPGHRYAIRVTAVDRAYNESRPADTTLFVPDDEAPLAPRAFQAGNHDGRWVDVSWAPSPSVDVRDYELRRTDLAGADSALLVATVPRVPGRAMSAVRDSTAEHGHRYAYRVTAVDSAGNVSLAAVDTVLFRGVVPPPPTRFVGARYVAGGVEVRWERVIDAELAGYAVYRGTTPTGTFTRLARVSPDSLHWMDPKPVAGAFYTVRAIDRSGNESRQAAAVPAVHPRGAR